MRFSLMEKTEGISSHNFLGIDIFYAEGNCLELEDEDGNDEGIQMQYNFIKDRWRRAVK